MKYERRSIEMRVKDSDMKIKNFSSIKYHEKIKDT
jgi:hypothetical protein